MNATISCCCGASVQVDALERAASSLLATFSREHAACRKAWAKAAATAPRPTSPATAAGAPHDRSDP